MTRPDRVLLVSPAFHGYWRAISDALAARGHDVRCVRYDENSSMARKVRHKIRHELRDRIGRDGSALAAAEMTDLAVTAVREHRPDVVVTIKGDVLGDDYWSAVADAGARRITWLYDELRRTGWTLDRLSGVGPVASYSPDDVEEMRRQGIEAEHLPLAHDSDLPMRRQDSDEVVFVGARYPNRERLLRALHDDGVPTRAYGKDWSAHLVDRARTWRVSRPEVPAGRDLDRADAYGAMAGATATLNIHGDQDGFTMRTFEACGVGALQLVDRPDVERHYEPGKEVLVFTHEDELVELARRAQREPGWARSIRAGGARRTAAEHTFHHRIAELERRWA